MTWALPIYEEDAVVIALADDSRPSQGTRAGVAGVTGPAG